MNCRKLNAKRHLPAVPRRGYTYLELLVSMPTVTMLLAGMVACLAILRQSVEFQDSTGNAQLQNARTLLRITSDLRETLSFSERSPAAVEFSVPDRDGDGIDDKVRYEWCGIAGSPLYYTFNSSPPEPILQDVRAFDLKYSLLADAKAPLDEELAVLKYHDDFAGANNKEKRLEHLDKSCAQFLKPALPEGATYWTIKRVRFIAKRDGHPDGVISVRITTADANQMPTSTIIDEQTVHESSLNKAFGWIEVDFTSANRLAPDQGYCIVLARVSTSGDSAGKVQFQEIDGGRVLTQDSHWMTSDDGGSTWSYPVINKDLRFFALGTYDNYVPETPQRVVAVHLGLQATSHASARGDTSVRIVNSPEVTE